MILSAGTGRAEVFDVKLGGRGPDGRLQPILRPGDDVYVEVLCTPSHPVRIGLIAFIDRNRDGVVQPGEEERMPPVELRDNSKSQSVADLEPGKGRIVVKLPSPIRKVGPVTLIVEASDPQSRRAAALKLGGNSVEEAWWHKFARLLAVERIVRAPDEDRANICLADLAGRTRKLLADGGAGTLESPRLSNDGKNIAYVERIGDEPRIVIANIDAPGKVLRTLQGGVWPVWLPKDKGLIFLRNGELFAVGFEENRDRSLGFSAIRIFPLPTTARDSLEIIAVAAGTGIDVPYRIEIDGATYAIRLKHRLHLDSDWDREQLSPSGDRYVLVKEGKLYLAQREEQEQVQLAESYRAFDPSWSPSGQVLVFVCLPR